jgi:hypothetical protein
VRNKDKPVKPSFHLRKMGNIVGVNWGMGGYFALTFMDNWSGNDILHGLGEGSGQTHKEYLGDG